MCKDVALLLVALFAMTGSALVAVLWVLYRLGVCAHRLQDVQHHLIEMRKAIRNRDA